MNCEMHDPAVVRTSHFNDKVQHLNFSVLTFSDKTESECKFYFTQPNHREISMAIAAVFRDSMAEGTDK